MTNKIDGVKPVVEVIRVASKVSKPRKLSFAEELEKRRAEEREKEARKPKMDVPVESSIQQGSVLMAQLLSEEK